MFCNIGFAESYYFKKCEMDENYLGSFLIDLDKKAIYRIFENINKKSVLEKVDKIQTIAKDQIISEIIQSGAGTDRYFQYYLEAAFKSVSIQKYKKDSELGIFIPDGPKQKSYCENVKADWYKSKDAKKIIEEKKQKEFEMEQARERLKAKKEKQAELVRKAQEKKKKEINQHRISIDGKFFQAAKPEKRLESEKKLKKNFNTKASELCSLTENFDILEQKVKVIEVGETTAFPKKGLTAGVRLGIIGVVECK